MITAIYIFTVIACIIVAMVVWSALKASAYRSEMEQLQNRHDEEWRAMLDTLTPEEKEFAKRTCEGLYRELETKIDEMKQQQNKQEEE